MITAKEVKVYDLTTDTGTYLGMFSVVSEWEGLKKLENLVDKTVMIVAPDKPETTAPLFNKMFQQIYGCEIVKDMHVISASPSIIAKIKNNEQSTAN